MQLLSHCQSQKGNTEINRGLPFPEIAFHFEHFKVNSSLNIFTSLNVALLRETMREKQNTLLESNYLVVEGLHIIWVLWLLCTW